MSFRRNRNRRDLWANFCKRNPTAIAETGLPKSLFTSERALSEYLTTGRGTHSEPALDSLEETRFWKLFDFVSSWFDYDAMCVTAFEARRVRIDSGEPTPTTLK